VQADYGPITNKNALSQKQTHRQMRLISASIFCSSSKPCTGSNLTMADDNDNIDHYGGKGHNKRCNNGKGCDDGKCPQ
jgi:hypothetical protein